MRNAAACTFAMAAAVVMGSPSAQTTTRLAGWVSDGHCTTAHMKAGGAACVRKCIAGATHVNPEWTPGGMVFVTEDKQVWKVDNADALWGYESQLVEIDAELKRERRSVRVIRFVGKKSVR